MISFEGPKVVLGISVSALSTELKSLDIIGEVLPEGEVKDFTSEGDTCSFKVKGGVSIHLENIFLLALSMRSASCFIHYFCCPYLRA